MQAVLLSAGLGTRLLPLTRNLPKPLIKIGNRPLIWFHLMHLKSYGITDFWINTHKFPEKFTSAFGDGSKLGIKIQYSNEKTLLGTAGALTNPKSNIQNDLKKSDFLVVYADNLTNFDHRGLIKFHNLKSGYATIGQYESKEPWTMGTIKSNANKRLIKFEEKPKKKNLTTNYVSAGIFICKPQILNLIPQGVPSSFEFDIFPKMLRQKLPVFVHHPKSYVQDCGTFERLQQARNDFASGKCKFKFDTI